MTSRDFCYWLQGHFEISNPITLDKKATALVKQHLELVYTHEKTPSMPFPQWLQGYFAIANPVELGENETHAVKKQLALVFKHEIDPTMGDDDHQQDLNDIHSNFFPGGGRDEDGVVYRC